MISSYDVGGSESRTMFIDIGTGIVIVRSNGQEKIL